jgi:tetratricopeptide (TPR) repeat protein
MIDLYKARKVDNVPEIILAINARRSVDARVIGVAAYALASRGYPEAALPIYDRALEFDPWDYAVRMNRASCLTRLGRWKDAIAVYTETVEQGYRGRSYHIHEMLGRLYDCYDQIKDVEGFIKWANESQATVNTKWRDEMQIDSANLLANKGRLDDAAQFYRRLMADPEDPTRARQAYDNYGGALFHKERFAEALAVYTEGLAKFPDGEEALTMLLARAETHARLKDNAGAIVDLVDAAKRWPDSQRAMGGVFRAATLAQAAGSTDQEKALLAQFLASPSTDFVLRQQAQERLAELKSPVTVPPK